MIDISKLKSGDKVRCKITDAIIDDAVIEIENGSIFICQNKKEGTKCKNLHGYNCSWRVDYEVSNLEYIDTYNKNFVISDNIYLEYLNEKFNIINIDNEKINVISFSDDDAKKLVSSFDESIKSGESVMINMSEYKVVLIMNIRKTLYFSRFFNLKNNFIQIIYNDDFTKIINSIKIIISERTQPKDDISFKDISEFEKIN